MSRELAEKLPNWFLGNKTQEDFGKLLNEFKGKPNLKFLEIGSFCGNSAAWTIENILTDKSSTLTCVDPWNGNILHEEFNFSDVEAAFDQQVEPFKDQLIKQKAYSDEWLMENRSKQYDFIYIDGDHMPQAFMMDALLSWELLKPGGIMAIDDYGWTHPRGVRYNPAAAIDMFVSMYSEHLTVLEKGWQVWIRKNIDYVRPEHIHE
jgi:predicted O-methyltransferase YrrM